MADSPSLPWQSSGVLASKSTGELANSMLGAEWDVDVRHVRAFGSHNNLHI